MRNFCTLSHYIWFKYSSEIILYFKVEMYISIGKKILILFEFVTGTYLLYALVKAIWRWLYIACRYSDDVTKQHFKI